MDLTLVEKNKNLNSLITMGANGFYPLFHESWIAEAEQLPRKKLTKKDQLTVKQVTKKILKHRNIERKKIILLSLPAEERNIFIRNFLNLVENKILDIGTELQ